MEDNQQLIDAYEQILLSWEIMARWLYGIIVVSMVGNGILIYALVTIWRDKTQMKHMLQTEANRYLSDGWKSRDKLEQGRDQ